MTYGKLRYLFSIGFLILKISANFPAFSASADYEKLTTNFNALITVLNISMTELGHLNFDASYLSRIRSGMR